MNKLHRIAVLAGVLSWTIGLTAGDNDGEPSWSLKTNLLYDATLTPNIGLEARTSNRTSMQVFYGLHPWKFSENKKLRHWSLMPEWRYWLKRQTAHSPNNQTPGLTGWFWGIHLVGGQYNASGKRLPFGMFKALRTNRYEGWYGGGGLTLGYAWRLGRQDSSNPMLSNWRLEAVVGIGYIHTRYHQYGADICDDDYGIGHYNYVGPTKLALNLCYNFGRKRQQPACEPVAPQPVVREVYKPDYRLAYITPQAEQQKTRQLSGRAFLDFVVNKTDIRPNYRGNAAELSKVLRTIDVVRQDSFTTITHISIHGYASPESPYQHNAYLAQARAEAFANYVQGLISLPKSIFTIESTPEDWEGLIARLNSLISPSSPISPISPSSLNVVLSIASDASLSPDEKERQLKRQHPKEWRYMLDSIFPALRHSDYEVNYTVRPFTVKEAARIIREKPQHLSLNEMFLVANTYTPGSLDYNDVFETAVRMYPNDATANHNAAVIALNKNDLDTAGRYLQKAGNSPEAQNARAVLAIREGRYEEGKQLLQQADIPEARHNLEELQYFINSFYY